MHGCNFFWMGSHTVISDGVSIVMIMPLNSPTTAAEHFEPLDATGVGVMWHSWEESHSGTR